jgi:membrane fusion protein (multidrug efflux system)
MTQWLRYAAEATGRNKMHRISAAGLVILGAAALNGCGKAPAAQGPPPALPVSVVTVQPSDVSVSNEWVGTLDGYVNAQIQPQASGYLIKQNYREGDQVQKGQVLFEIDPRPFQAALDQAKGQLAQAKGQVLQAQAQLGLAEINVKRDTPLAQARAIAQSQLDNDTQTKLQTEASVESAKASVAAAEAAVENAELNLGFCHVRSLISGVAGQATTQVGALVNTQTVLTAVSQLNPIKVYFSISDAEYLSLVQRAQTKGDLLKSESAIPLTLTLANNEVYPQKGHIVFVDRQMNAQTGAIRVVAAFPNPKNILRPGQFGRVRGETEVRHNAILVPQVAVTELQGLQQIYTVGDDHKAHVATIQLGPQIGKDWLVEGGVAPGSQVIVDNLQKLRDGAPVNPHPAPATPAEAPNAAGN